MGGGLNRSSDDASGNRRGAKGSSHSVNNIITTRKGRIRMEGTKSVPVTQAMVWEAFMKVKANRGKAGIDGQSLSDFEKKIEDNLYKIWNRLSSGS
jgi:RNA-directed DNA polymerase